MEKAIACFTIGELFWEFFRFAPHVFYKKTIEYKGVNPKLIVLTRSDRFDIYGKYADILIPLEITGDNKEYIQNSYRLDNFPIDQYNKISEALMKMLSDNYEVLEVIKPDISKLMFSNKQQYPESKMLYDFNPRAQNIIEVDNYINKKDKVVTLAPRFRSNMKRNWPYWQELYDMIYNSDLPNKFKFVICGKDPDYIPDEKNRFLDINKMKIVGNVSLFGILMDVIRRSCLTVGSQSAIPNISLIYGVEALEWGHQKMLHTVEYNIKKTKVTFLEDIEYNISPQVIFYKMVEILGGK